MNRALTDKNRKITEEIRRAVDAIWETENPTQTNSRHGKGGQDETAESRQRAWRGSCKEQSRGNLKCKGTEHGKRRGREIEGEEGVEPTGRVEPECQVNRGAIRE